MKWSHKSAERIWKWPIIIVTAPVWIPLAGFLIAGIQIDRWCAKLAEKMRPSTEPHQWFAWRPVSFSVWTDSYGESAWMETVWRAHGRWGETIYAPTRESLEHAK